VALPEVKKAAPPEGSDQRTGRRRRARAAG
jgi:hypothetical protein